MKVSKNTVSELLDMYLTNKEISIDIREKIKDSLFNDVNKQVKKKEEKEKGDLKKEKEREKKERKKSKLSHGTSCPRISTNTNELLVEF